MIHHQVISSHPMNYTLSYPRSYTNHSSATSIMAAGREYRRETIGKNSHGFEIHLFTKLTLLQLLIFHILCLGLLANTASHTPSPQTARRAHSQCNVYSNSNNSIGPTTGDLETGGKTHGEVVMSRTTSTSTYMVIMVEEVDLCTRSE